MKTFDEISEIVSLEMEKLQWTSEPRGLYEPIEYVLSMGGKRIRLVLALMACNLFSNDLEEAIAPALGLEVFHNFTLLHDDIMDKADMRRGKPTVHKKWNDNTAILSGDVMQIASYQLIAKTNTVYLKQVLDLFSQTAMEICEGQQYDVDFEMRDDVSVEDYIEMIRLKTAVLLACALKTGALIGGSNNENAQLLYDFGINLGLAFQLKDDFLDVYGDEATFGKKIGGDIVCNKKTFMLIKLIEIAQGDDALELQKWLGISDENKFNDKILAITTLYNKLGIKAKCEDKMHEFYTKAVANLDNLGILDNKKQELRNLAANLMFRNN
jgi:geranylgeranyl diphosphate synthase type II